MEKGAETWGRERGCGEGGRDRVVRRGAETWGRERGCEEGGRDMGEREGVWRGVRDTGVGRGGQTHKSGIDGKDRDKGGVEVGGRDTKGS